MPEIYRELKFTIFGNLPKELRLTIWEYTLAPRVVAVKSIEIAPTYLQWYRKKLGWDKRLPICSAGQISSFVEAGLDQVRKEHTISTAAMKDLDAQVHRAVSLLISGRPWDASKRFNLRSMASAYTIAGVESKYLTALLKLSGEIDLEVLLNFTSHIPPDDSPPVVNEKVRDVYDVRRDELGLLSPVHILKSGYRPPAILSVCKESRELALQHYEMSFITHEGLQGTYFDFENDTLFLGYDQFQDDDQGFFQVNSILNMLDGPFINLLWGCVDHDNMARVKKLAYLVNPQAQGIEEEDADDRTKWIAFMLNAFQGVEKLTIVIDQLAEEDEEYGPMKLIDPIHVNNTISNYERFSPSVALSLELPEEEELELDVVEVDPDQVMEKLADTFWEGEEDDLPEVPEIEYKVALSREYEYELEYAREACQARIDDYCRKDEVHTFEEY